MEETRMRETDVPRRACHIQNSRGRGAHTGFCDSWQIFLKENVLKLRLYNKAEKAAKALEPERVRADAIDKCVEGENRRKERTREAEARTGSLSMSYRPMQCHCPYWGVEFLLKYMNICYPPYKCFPDGLHDLF